MGKFSLMGSRYHGGKALRNEKKRVLEDANRAILDCETVILDRKTTEILNQSDEHFLKALSENHKTRVNEIHLFSANNAVISERTHFINQLLPLVEKNDTQGQLALLSEEKIRSFKGVFSQRLYDLLCERRKELNNTTEIIENNYK